jgi:hypothetical protein
VASAFGLAVVACCTETQRLLESARAAGHEATLAGSRRTSAFLNREADIEEFRMIDDEPWGRSFQFVMSFNSTLIKKGSR